LGLVGTIASDPDDKVALDALSLVDSLDPRTLDDAHYAMARKFAAKTLGPLARKLGWTRGKKDSDDRQKLRQAIVPLVAHAGDAKLTAAARKLAATWLDTGKGVSDDLIDGVLSAALRDGDAKEFDHVLELARKAKD